MLILHYHLSPKSWLKVVDLFDFCGGSYFLGGGGGGGGFCCLGGGGFCCCGLVDYPHKLANPVSAGGLV